MQNLAEARYLVSLYQYLRLRGHPADKISVLTTYNGQKALLREEIEHRCAGSDFARAMFGRPLKVCLAKVSRMGSIDWAAPCSHIWYICSYVKTPQQCSWGASSLCDGRQALQAVISAAGHVVLL